MLLWCLMKILLIWGITCIISSSSQSEDFDSDCDEFYNNSCFTHSRIPLQAPYPSWEESEQSCISKGGHLTSILSQNENEMLINLVKTRNNDNPNSFAWIGLKYLSYDEGFSDWADGSTVTYIKNTPDNRNSGCIILLGTGIWYADHCTENRNYICRNTGSAFALKNGDDYESITDGFTINTSPTTLACRTDSYPQARQIMWEYKASEGGTWNSRAGSWDHTSGISELTLSENGIYRCNVKSGGIEQIYTATLQDPSLTTAGTTTTGTTQTTKTQSMTLKPLTTTAVDPTTFNFLSGRNIGILSGLIAFVLLLVLCISILSIVIITCCVKRRKRNTNFTRIKADENQAKLENQSKSSANPGTKNEYSQQTIGKGYLTGNQDPIRQPTNISSDNYVPMDVVDNKENYVPMTVVESKDDYIPMAEVDHRVEEHNYTFSPYENLSNSEVGNYSEITDLASEESNFAKLLTISDADLGKRFKSLNSESHKLRNQHKSTIAKEPQNKPKNAIENILPYDNNRVILTTEGQNDYINASYVNNYQFIVTTHPMENTLPDFLQMICQTNASLVIMLSMKNELSEIEWKISKGVQYWGKQGSVKEYGHFVVKTSEVKKSTNMTMQTLIVHNANENNENTFKQVISTGWEDKTNKLKLESIVKLVKLVLEHKKQNPDHPIVIHCIDSIGRTGVLATVLKVIEEMEQNGNADVDKVLLHLRSERNYFVPILTHYTGCYSILSEYYRSIN